MVLGTVELGLDYGVNNRDGKLSYHQAYEILEAAWAGGVRELDTAAAYGDSESFIGLFKRDTGVDFLIDTKLPMNVEHRTVGSCVNSACSKMNTSCLNIVYLHSFEQCRDDSIIDSLTKELRDGRIFHIGVSIYEPQEMEYIVNNLPEVDTIQFPFNILDNWRWESGQTMEKAIKKGKRLYARSVFLQGLLFADKSSEVVVRLGALKYIDKVSELAGYAGVSVPELAYRFVLEKSEIYNIILGCHRKDEVIANLAIENSDMMLDSRIKRELLLLSKSVPIRLIDPRKW